MSISDYKDPIISQWYTSGNIKYSKPVSNEPHIVVGGMFALIGLPDIQSRVVIDGYVELNLKDKITNSNQFKVDYTNGYVFMHSSKEGASVTVKSYSSRGVNYYPSSRIYTKLNNFGEVIETLDDVSGRIGEITGVVSNLDQTIGTANNLKVDLESQVGTGNTLKEELNTSIELAETKNTQLSNTIINASTSKENLDISIGDASVKKIEIDESIYNSNLAKSSLDTTIDNASVLKNNLDTTITTGAELDVNLKASIVQGNQLNTELPPLIEGAQTASVDLGDKTDVANTAKGGLDDSIVLGENLKTNLDQKIVDGGTLKTAIDISLLEGNRLEVALPPLVEEANSSKLNLESEIVLGDQTKVNLDNSITQANSIKGELDSILQGADIGAMATDINDLKEVKHTHSNKVVIDGLSDLNGSLQYNSLPVGQGDMEKSIYDTNNNGKVDMSEDSEKLDGQLSTYYAKQSDLDNKVDNSRVLTDVPLDAKFTDTVTDIANNLTETVEGKALDATQGKALDDRIGVLSTNIDATTVVISELEFSELSSTATNMDDEGVYVNTEWKRKDLTLYAKSTLLGVSPNYNQIKIDYYNDLGTTIIKTITWNLTYDVNGFPYIRMVA